MLRFFTNSKNGVEVYYDPVGSHAATHFNDSPQLEEITKTVVNGLILNSEEVAKQVDIGRIIGTCDVVKVNEGDEITYAVRKNREDDGLVPFVKNRSPEPCSTISLHLLPQKDGSYVLSSAWIGTMDPDDQPFPHSPNATERSIEYTDKHAFIYRSQEIIEGTETVIKPW